VVGRRAAATARAVLPLLSRPSAESGAPQVEVPVTLEDRTLAWRASGDAAAAWEWPVERWRSRPGVRTNPGT
jgi:hypothetical protein